MNRVVHLGYMHSIFDTRIFQKECNSIKNKLKVEVFYITSDRNSEFQNSIVDGVNIETIKLKNIRFFRLLLYLHELKRECININAEIYHIHEPVLLPLVSFLKKQNKKVIYDKHEDTYEDAVKHASDILGKKLGIIIGRLVTYYERKCINQCDGFIYVTPAFIEHPKNKQTLTIMVPNFPKLALNRHTNFKREIGNSFTLCFGGGASDIWSILEIVKVINEISNEKIEFEVVGNITQNYLEDIKSVDKHNKFKYKGSVPFIEVGKMYRNCNVGMALLKKEIGCLSKSGTLANTKIFEYMQEGLPVIFTDFTIWKKIAEEYDFGIAVDPDNPIQIKNAIEFLINNPDIAAKKGNEGKRAIEEKYNWEESEIALIDMYKMILIKE